MLKNCWLVSLNARDCLEGPSLEVRLILKWNLTRQVTWLWIGFIRLKIGTSGRIVCTSC
jgi:hypothetical protein